MGQAEKEWLGKISSQSRSVGLVAPGDILVETSRGEQGVWNGLSVPTLGGRTALWLGFGFDVELQWVHMPVTRPMVA